MSICSGILGCAGIAVSELMRKPHLRLSLLPTRSRQIVHPVLRLAVLQHALRMKRVKAFFCRRAQGAGNGFRIAVSLRYQCDVKPITLDLKLKISVVTFQVISHATHNGIRSEKLCANEGRKVEPAQRQLRILKLGSAIWRTRELKTKNSLLSAIQSGIRRQNAPEYAICVSK